MHQAVVAGVFLLAAAVIAIWSSYYIRRTVADYASQNAQLIAYEIANRVISEQIAKGDMTYDDIVLLSRNSQNEVSSLEIDIAKINLLKSRISIGISEAVSGENEYIISVPVGTLFGNEYTLGMGPKITFKMQMSAVAVTDFKSNFYNAGINQVLHQILINVQISGNVIIPWYQTGYYTETSVIAAQTVLVGTTPDAYTNVIESYSYGQDGVVGDLFDYGAAVN